MRESGTSKKFLITMFLITKFIILKFLITKFLKFNVPNVTKFHKRPSNYQYMVMCISW